MSKLRSLENMEVWQRSEALSALAFSLSSSFPPEELFGVTLRFRHLSSAVLTQIAEGYGSDVFCLVKSLDITRNYLSELKQTAILAHKLNYIKTDDFYLLGKQWTDLNTLATKLIFTLKHK